MSYLAVEAIAALEQVQRVCGAQANVSVRAWLVQNAIRRCASADASAFVSEMGDDAIRDCLTGPAFDATTQAIVSVRQWLAWQRYGRWVCCPICEEPDPTGPLVDGRCSSCRDAAAEAGVPGVVLAVAETGRDESGFDDPDDVEPDDFSEADDVTF